MIVLVLLLPNQEYVGHVDIELIFGTTMMNLPIYLFFCSSLSDEAHHGKAQLKGAYQLRMN